MECFWSTQQLDIFGWFERGYTLEDNTSDHLVVRALAGTGKTTVIVEGVKRAPEKSILIAAFSKIIQLELESRFTIFDASGKRIRTHPHIKAQTLHSVGLGCVRRFKDRIQVDFTSARADKLTDTVCGMKVPDAVKRLISKLHTKGREIAPHARVVGDLTNLAIQFECEPDEQWAKSGFPLEVVEDYALQAMELASQVNSGDTIDGSDMIFLPIRNGWLMGMFDLIVIDEAQDMTPAQLEIAIGVLKAGGRICVVGDPNQAIFGFRGADSTSIDRLKSELKAAELGLTTTYRCGKRIVELAQGYVPDFEAHESNSNGTIERLLAHKLIDAAGPGDYILSRVNAPLVSIAMKLLRQGKRTRIAGRDIGKGLISLVRKMKGRSVPDFLNKVAAWETKEINRLEGLLEKAVNGRKLTIKTKMEEIHDQAEMLLSLADGATGISAIEANIEGLFSDDGLGTAGMITCSSVHRAKGLEADRVFILEETLRDYSQEERNIAYVAITRAKKTLVWVGSRKQEEETL